MSHAGEKSCHGPVNPMQSLHSLRSLASQLLEHNDPEQLLPKLLAQAEHVFNAHSGLIALLDPLNQKKLCLRFGSGVHAGLIGSFVKSHEGSIGIALKTSEVHVVEDYQHWPHRIKDRNLAEISTLITAPLTLERRSIGAIQLSWLNDPHPFTDYDVAAFRQFSLLASIALEKATLFQRLQNEQAVLQAVFDGIPGFIYLYDDQDLLVRWNKALEAVSGYSPEELSTMHCLDWFRHSRTDMENVAEGMDRARQEGFGATESSIQARDGSIKQVYLTAVPVNIGGKQYISGVGLDITEKKQASEDKNRSEAKFRNLVEASPLGIHLYHLEPDGRLLLAHSNRTADLLTRSVNHELIGQPIEKTFPSLTNTFVPNLCRCIARGEQDCHRFEVFRDFAEGRIYYHVTAYRIDTNSIAVKFMDITEQKSTLEELRQHRDQLEILVEERTGDLTAANQELTAMNEEICTINETLECTNRRLEAEIITRQQEEAKLSRRERQYRATTRLLTGTVQDVDSCLENILHDALQLLNAPSGYIALYDEKRKMLPVRYAVGPMEAFVGEPRPVDDSLQSRVFKSGKFLYCEDYSKFPQRLTDPHFSRLTSVIMVPLWQGSLTKGILSVSWLDDVHPLAEEDQDILRQYGDLASIVLERANAQECIARKSQLVMGLADTTAALLGQLDLNVVLQDILDKATQLTGLPHGFVRLLDTDGSTVGFQVNRGKYDNKSSGRTEYRREFIDEVLRSGEIIVIEDTENHPLLKEVALSEGITLALQAPLKVEGKVIGVIGLSAFGEPVSLDEEKIVAVGQFAIAASLAVKNALQHEKARVLAFHDTLTGLPNRAGLQKQLVAELQLARDNKSKGAILFIDLDDLKTINDTMGHSAGDEVIITTSRHIVAIMGKKAFVARIGGDEFVVILPGCDDKAMISDLADIAIQALSQEYLIAGKHLHMSASIGIALYPKDSSTIEDALKNADNAMYAAKRAGRNCWRFYEPSLQEEAFEKIVLTNSLRRALVQNEFSLYFQPVASTHGSRIVGFEALLRWKSPEHGNVPPDRFIPFAEQSGLILPIGNWVLQESCRFARQIADLGFSHLHISVNISPRQLAADDFVATVRASIARAGIDARQLDLEVTESTLISSMEESVDKLIKLRNLGVNVALDDFGTGYSSLTYLRRLPVNTLKIDKSFIDTILDDATQLRFVGFIIAMAHSLDLTVVAEGVENKEQLTCLAQVGCDCIQGYLFSPPVPESEAILKLR